MPASAYTWNIDFLHEGHVHPGTPITGVTSGTFTIPTSGHDFSGFTRYRITLTVTDSDGLQSSQSVTIFPDKVNLTFDTAPGGLTLYLDGIAPRAPFVYDTLKGFNHTIRARNQTVGTNTYNFASDGPTAAPSSIRRSSVPAASTKHMPRLTRRSQILFDRDLLLDGVSTRLPERAPLTVRATATLLRSSTVYAYAGKYGGGLAFDGANDYIGRAQFAFA